MDKLTQDAARQWNMWRGFFARRLADGQSPLELAKIAFLRGVVVGTEWTVNYLREGKTK